MVEHILFSGHSIISNLSFLHISNVISHSFFTAAQSTKTSIFSSSKLFHVSKLFFIASAHSGSTHITLVFLLNRFLAIICHDMNQPHPIGHI